MSAASLPPRVMIVLGGIPLYGLELATIEVGRVLREAGAEVLFITNAHWGRNAVEPRLDALGLPHRGVVFFGSVERGLSWRRSFALLRWMVSENWRLRRIARAFRPTHLHVVSHWDFLNLLPFLSLSSQPLTFQAHNSPHVRHRLSAWLWRRIFARASTFVAVSHHLAAQFAAIGMPSERLRVIYNAPPQRVAVNDVEPPPRRERTLHVLFVGQISEHKGATVLVDAVLALRRRHIAVECVLIGDCETPYARALRARVADASDTVMFAGYVADPTPWFTRADVHVAPSLIEEAFGIVVSEAKVAGLPSIVSAVGALPELIRDGIDGRVIPPADAEALADALARYASDADWRASHARAARDSVARLGIDRVAAQWTRLYGGASA